MGRFPATEIRNYIGLNTKQLPPSVQPESLHYFAKLRILIKFTIRNQTVDPAMRHIKLPPSVNEAKISELSGTRQITLIGANGAGKTRFMEEMTELNGDKSFCLSALSASFPEREESTRPGSIDSLYRKAITRQSYMRSDAVSELDKLIYMVFADELEYLLDIKENSGYDEKKLKLRTTKLDIIRRLWEKIFPGNKIRRHHGALMFTTTSGDDLIDASRLSQGEKTVLYYIAAVLYAPKEAVIFIDSPTLFIHHSILSNLWTSIEELRPDCVFVYNSVDVDFITTRTSNTCIWVKSFDSEKKVWDYTVLDHTPISEDLFIELAGSRRPVLFIEGDAQHSIDAKLYSLVFSDWTVRPLGSCNKVIETTRTFNDLKYMHHLRSRGIVDRDRRTEVEVGYLRRKEILVPDVAEVENIFLLEPVVRIMATRRGRDAKKIVAKVKREVIRSFKQHSEEQALQHVRHKVKRDVECKIDARFSCITALETHLRTLIYKLEPRKHYNKLREEFAIMVRDSDYDGILRVFNHKPMITDCGLPQMLGYKSKEEYIAGTLDTLRGDSKDARVIRETIKHCFHADEDESNPAEN